jgi:BlaI family penicillinase repressor
MLLTKSEREIMDVLWNAGEPLSRSDFLERSETKPWKDSSVHILLNSLLRKGMIREAGLIKRSKTFGRTFLPTMSREAYYVAAAFSHRYKPDYLMVMEALLDRPEADEETLKQLLAIVEAKMK